MTERLDRRLVAVMFTDVVGYTAVMQHDEQAAVDTRDRYMEAIQRHHDAFQGTIVQRLGDGTMSMFPSALDAVLAAVAIQEELRLVAGSHPNSWMGLPSSPSPTLQTPEDVIPALADALDVKEAEGRETGFPGPSDRVC